VILACALLVVCAGLIFAFAGGWQANLLAVLLLATAHAGPYFTFTRGTVFPFMPGVLCAWLAVVSAAAWRHLVTRRKLVKAEASQQRYARAMQFVTHEMRTPLTAIQGSSELITRYALPDEKRKQIAGMINSESKRLARMIETFLDVERLSAGEMELKHERFGAAALVEQCVTRVRPLAERKNIAIATEAVPEADLTGDRELMEYAVYNLLTNAVKYSPPETRVVVSGGRARGEMRLWVEDQGIGMDKHEIRRVFERFYRTKKAEQSGEMGSGIGLSIVEQIVVQHGGSILVDSTPGKGSRFTLVLPLSTS
jgi:signal transduction histidine kinase